MYLGKWLLKAPKQTETHRFAISYQLEMYEIQCPPIVNMSY